MREDLSEEELNEEVLEDYTLDDTSSMPSSSGIQIPKVSIKDIARTTVDNTGKAVDTAGKGVQAAGKTAEVAGKGTEAAGKGAQAAGKSLQAAGKGAQAAGDAVASASSALGAIPYVGGVLAGAGKVAGGATKAVGKGAEVAGTGIDKAGAGMEKAGQGMQQTGKNINKTGKGISDTGKRIREAAGNKKGISSSEIGAKLEDKFSTENITEEAKKGVKKKIKNIKQDIKDAMNPTDMSLGAQIRRIKRLAKLYFTLLLGYIVVVAILIYILFSPILDAIQWMDDHWDSISTRAEKTNNFYAGFGNQSTKEAFFEELNYLYGEYDEQLDVPLIMATLFYKEREGYNTSYSGVPKDDTGDLAELDTATLIKQATSFLKTKYKDLYETLDEDGKNYTIGKIYRLRKLARHQLDSSLFGGLPSETEEIPLKDFLERVEDRMSADLYQLYQSVASVSGETDEIILAFLVDRLREIYELISIADGSETWTTTSFANWSEPATALGNLLKESILTGLEIQTVRWDKDDKEFKVTIAKYDYNEDNYKKYLKDYYVRKMPEFSENLVALSDEEKEREIDKIIKGIYEYSDQFKEIYGYVEVGSSEEYSEECIGNLDETLVSKLLLPIKEGGTYSFTGEYAYGISNGVTNNGLDLNSSTAGVKEGDDVYAIAAGKVTEVVSNIKCNTSDDSTCNPLGNYIKIEHTIKEDDQTFKIVSIYTNLKAGSVKLKKKDKVKKGDVIGKIGKTGDVTEAQLHFEIHDISNGDIPLNPTNLFIPCVSSGSLVGADNEEKIWFYLTKIAKYPKKAAAGAMGNLSKESAGFHPEIVQGDVPISKYSYDYTNKVDKKTISEYNFVNNGPGGGGYGLAQWTYYTRKQELYDLMEKRKTSIGDLEMQLEHLKNEIASNEWTSAQRKNWENASTPSEAARIFCVYFERPGAGCSTERETIAEQIYKKYKDKKYSSNITIDNIGGVEGQTRAKNWSDEKKIKYLFPDGVPQNEAQLKKYLTDVTVPITTKSGKKTTTTVTVHKAIAGDIKAALTAAQAEGFRVYEIGGYREFGSDKAGKVSSVGLVYSQHCYGLAVDINVNENCYKSPPTAACSVGKLYSPGSNQYSITTNGALYKSFISNGWGWGGNWNSLKDYMHFSFFGV